MCRYGRSAACCVCWFFGAEALLNTCHRSAHHSRARASERRGYSGYIPACESIPYSVKDETRRLVPAASMQRDVRRPVRAPSLVKRAYKYPPISCQPADAEALLAALARKLAAASSRPLRGHYLRLRLLPHSRGASQGADRKVRNALLQPRASGREATRRLTSFAWAGGTPTVVTGWAQAKRRPGGLALRRPQQRHSALR